MARRAKIGTAIAVAAILAAVAWLVVGRSGDEAKHSAVSATRSTTAPTTGATSAALTAKAATQLAADLVSANMANYRSAWYDTTTVPPVAPAGTTLVIDAGTFTSQQDAGKVNATVTLPGEAPATWQLLLLYKNGRWVVYTMEEVK